jgi:hypothetical protein
MKKKRGRARGKWPIAVGILLLALTPILLASCNMPVFTSVVRIEQADAATDLSRWECEGNFSAGDVILLDLLQNSQWSSAYFDVIAGVPVFYVDISITDPKNSVSQYEILYTYNPSSGQRRLMIVNATMLSAGDGINQTVVLPSSFHNPVTFIAGTADVNGTYFANVTSAGGTADYRLTPELSLYEPGAFALYSGHTVKQESHPYADLLYVNFVTIPAGVLLLIYELQNTKRTWKRVKDDAVPR